MFEDFKNDFCEQYRDLYNVSMQEMKKTPEISRGVIEVYKEHSWDSNGEFNGYRFITDDNREIEIKNFDDVVNYLADLGYNSYEFEFNNHYKFINPELKDEFDRVSKEIKEYNDNIFSAGDELLEHAKTDMFNLFENTYIRFGLVPKDERSFNFMDKTKENGVSCFAAVKIGEEYVVDIVEGMVTFFGYIDQKPIYEINGTPIEDKGSDGEPLLHNVQVIKENISSKNVHAIDDFVYDYLFAKK